MCFFSLNVVMLSWPYYITWLDRFKIGKIVDVWTYSKIQIDGVSKWLTYANIWRRCFTARSIGAIRVKRLRSIGYGMVDRSSKDTRKMITMSEGAGLILCKWRRFGFRRIDQGTDRAGRRRIGRATEIAGIPYTYISENHQSHAGGQQHQGNLGFVGDIIA